MSGYKIEIKPVPATSRRTAGFEVTPHGLYRDDPRGNAYIFFSLHMARQYARKLGNELGFWVHDYTAIKNGKPTYI